MASRKYAKIGKKCIVCGTCVRSCPRSAIRISNENAVIVNTDKCVGCGICASDCPVGNIELVLRSN